ncbi:hypothetical protein NIES4074_12860 [Cylindrospermum sp. NIES-4074]|nr:hypothetical protein NIES4074_12860 [Cylindrospermum sp. NIES-4074]
MPEYTLVVKIPNAGNKEISYSVNLTVAETRYPEDYFAIEDHKSCLRESIQTKTVRQVSDIQLKRIIYEWTEDIKQNLRRTTVTVDLPTGTFVTSPITTAEPTSTPTQIQSNTFPAPPSKPFPASKPPLRHPSSESTPAKPTAEEKSGTEIIIEKRRKGNKFDDFDS